MDSIVFFVLMLFTLKADVNCEGKHIFFSFGWFYNTISFQSYLSFKLVKWNKAEKGRESFNYAKNTGHFAIANQMDRLGSTAKWSKIV